MSESAENSQPMASAGASENPADDGRDPSPRSDSRPAFDEAAFRKGFGKGAEKGRQEGASAILEHLGLPTDPTAALEALDSLRGGKPPGDPEQGRQDPRVQELAKAAKRYEAELTALRRRAEILERQADEARREKIRSAAVRLGVGHDQTDALLALYGDRISMSESGDLEVISEVAGERVSGVASLDDFIGEIVQARPWLAAPRSAKGSGFEYSPESEEKPRKNIMFDVRPLAERVRG